MNLFLGTDQRTPQGDPLPPDPVFARWYDRINSGARFHLNLKDQLLSPEGEPYLRLPLAQAEEAGYSFTELALMLYNGNIGAILTQPDGNLASYSDHMPISLGDVADFLTTGRFLHRVPLTPPWGYPTNRLEEEPTILQEVDMVTLPINLRRNIAWFLGQAGATATALSLVETTPGKRYLWFTFQKDQKLSAPESEGLAARIFWCLPRYYAVRITQTSQVKGYPIIPSEYL